MGVCIYGGSGPGNADFRQNHRGACLVGTGAPEPGSFWFPLLPTSLFTCGQKTHEDWGSTVSKGFLSFTSGLSFLHVRHRVLVPPAQPQRDPLPQERTAARGVRFSRSGKLARRPRSRRVLARTRAALQQALVSLLPRLLAATLAFGTWPVQVRLPFCGSDLYSENMQLESLFLY